MSTLSKLGALIAGIIILANPTFAKENAGGSGKTASYYKSLAVDCPAASSQAVLQINNVRTTLLNGGDLWWNLNDARYEVPKVDPTSGQPSVHSLFAGAIWLGGIDAGGQLKIAAQTYRQSGNDFWPGPLDNVASTNQTVCQSYDRHWEVLGADIDEFRTLTFPTDPNAIAAISATASGILEWPGIGNPYARDANGFPLNVDQDLAPFYDADADGLYDPTQGDFPVINPAGGQVYGDQMIYWVYNDRGNIHTETGGQAIGVQVGALAFAFATSDEVNNMTFYRYDILNKAASPIGQFYMGQWVDADLGCFNNDYVGCDTALSLGFAYNGTGTDPDCATRGYGVNVPIIGTDYFEGPFADLNNGIDDDQDGLVDEGTDGLDNDGDGVVDNIEEREKLGMSTFTYYNNDFTITGNPETAVHFYNYMVGFWKDGTPFTSDVCNAYGGAVRTTYMFPSDPDGPAFPSSWSECSCNNTPADRRWLQASGPFTLQPGARNNITVGAVWVRQSSQSGCAADIDLLRNADLKAQALFDNNFKLVDGPDAPTLVIRELDQEIIISLVNLESSNNFQESYDEIDPIVRSLAELDPSITDTTYTFQGYKIYQLKNDQVGADQLNDPTLARLVAQVDVRDGVANIINKTFTPSLCAEVPELMVDGNNEGVRHSFQVKTDLFATGTQQTVVNHKTYYYTAIAYAYNYYNTGVVQDISTDCGLLPVVEEQKTPYLQGRRNYKVYTAIPHINSASTAGNVLNAQYGDRLDITRLEGAGNGGYDLIMKDTSVLEILNSDDAFYGPVIYQGGNAPIDVKIFDPYVVVDQDFTFYMLDSTGIDSTTGFVKETAKWMIVSSPNNDTIYADKDINYSGEQLIPKYGISIALNQVENVGEDWQDAPANLGLIDARIEFEDPEEQWLTGVQDQSTFSYLNWIRSGQYFESAQTEEYFNFFDDHFVGIKDDTGSRQPRFYDPFEQFENMINATWAPYCLATNAINGSLRAGQNTLWPTIYTFGPAFPDTFRYQSTGPNDRYMVQPQNTLEGLTSVDVVLTSDKSKWTRCVVIEMGENVDFNENGTYKGHIRNVPSRDVDGNIIPGDTGRSYFPGYAINLETGERLNLMFGEDSGLAGENGRDMIWNPTNSVLSPLNQVLFGGRHCIYVMNSRYDEGEFLRDTMLDNWNVFDTIGAFNNERYGHPNARPVFDNIMWVTQPVVADGYSLNSIADGLIPWETKVELRVRKPFASYEVDNSNQGLPKYFFSTNGFAADTNVTDVAVDFLEEIKAVPNPYYAYSAYETSQLDNRIKIINLPSNCTVTIFSIDGQLIRRFERDVATVTSAGSETEKVNLDSSIDWDLKNASNIPIASGVYLIHVEAPGLGEKVIKWFGVLRPTDLDTF